MSGQAAQGRAEQQLLARPRLIALATAVVVAITASVFAAIAGYAILIRVQQLDDAWLHLMTSGRSASIRGPASTGCKRAAGVVLLPPQVVEVDAVPGMGGGGDTDDPGGARWR